MPAPYSWGNLRLWEVERRLEALRRRTGFRDPREGRRDLPLGRLALQELGWGLAVLAALLGALALLLPLAL